MMTSKRVVMLIAGFIGLVFVYMGYARSYVGAIDGLPALPERYRLGEPEGETTQVPPTTRDAKIKQAFGEECPELTRAFRLEVRNQGMVLSSGTPQVQEDGTVLLKPVSIAMFGKKNVNTPNVEINTIRAQSAVLTFERPVKTESDIGTSKVVKASLEGNGGPDGPKGIPTGDPIIVVNNRSTLDKSDDLFLYVAKGPLVFDDKEHTLTTDDNVHVIDRQSKPKPVEVFGTGMRVDLIADPPAKGAQAHARNNTKNDTIRGVKRVTLNSNVRMYLFADGKNNFMGGTPEPKGPKPAARDKASENAVEKDLITIRTAGVFRYDLEKDHDFARFDAPADAADLPSENRQVFVDRIHVMPPGTSFWRRVLPPPADHMRCQVLELRLHRKDSGKEAAKEGSAPDAPVAGTGPRPDQGMDRGLDIEWAHATGHPVPGRLVTIQSDVESLVEAEGIEFTYEVHPPAPSITILTGCLRRPMMAITRDGTIIHAQQITLKSRPQAQTSDRTQGQQDGYAKGPSLKGWWLRALFGIGHVEIIDKKDPKNVKIQHAWFNDELIFDRDDGKDRLTLTGNACFLDQPSPNDPTAGPTTLEGDVLKVWLEVLEPEAPPEKSTPADKVRTTPANNGKAVVQAETPASAIPDTPEPAPTRRPHHVEAIGRVSAHSKDMYIHDTGRLVIRFKDVPAEQLPAPKPATPARTVETTTPKVTVTVIQGTAPPPPAPTTVVQTPAQAAAETPRPLDVSARNVEALMLRSPERSQMQEVHCAIDVRVHQDHDPTHPEEKDVLILGDSLDTRYQCEGCQYILVKGDLAQLQLDKIYIVAPEVHIDQQANKAWAYCPGAMTIESTTNFNGEALVDAQGKPAPELLTVHWSESMLVYGDYAEFHGNVLADQKAPKAKLEDEPTSRMACEVLQLFFDRPISLRGDHRGEPQPKVRTLVCDRNVMVEQITLEEILDAAGRFDHYGKLIKKQTITGTGLTETALDVDTPTPAPTRPVQGRPGPMGTGANAPKPAPSGNEVNVSGPGLVRTFGPGSDPSANPDGPPSDKKPKPASAPKKSQEPQETKLTLIEFRKRTYANNQSKTAKFWESVRVLDLPSKDPDLKLNIDDYQTPGSLPPGAMFLNCAQLTVLDRGEEGKPKREMKAVGRVLVQGPDFWGRAETVTYNEDKDQLIFDGGANGIATLARLGPRGGALNSNLQGKRITYIKSTGECKIDGGAWFSSTPK